MDIYLFFTGEIFKNHIEIGSKFLGISCTAGIITRSLYTTRQSVVGTLFKTSYVITLPTVNGNRRFIAYLHGLIDIDAEFCVIFFRVFVTFFYIVHNDSCSILLRVFRTHL